MVRQGSTLTAAHLSLGQQRIASRQLSLGSLSCLIGQLQFNKCFLSLIDLHFPKSNPLQKIFNQNTIIKILRYSRKSNDKTITSNHNKSELNKHKQTDVNKNNNNVIIQCNFWNPKACPMDRISKRDIHTNCQGNIYLTYNVAQHFN